MAMKKLVTVLAVLIGLAALFIGTLAYNAGGFDANRMLAAALNFRFGNFGGGQGGPGDRSFDPDAIKFGIRWYPTYVSFGPDNDTLLVSLCHVQRNDFCRIAKYSLSKDKWDIYAFDERFSYDTPMFSPDGQWIYYSATSLCGEQREACDRPRLYRMHADGSNAELFDDVAPVAPSFSLDGKRLIFWGRHNRNSLANTEVHYLDLETRREVPLTEHEYNFERPAPPFFTADGEHFIFNADFSRWQGKTSCAVDPATIPADPKTGKKDLGPLFGDKEDTHLYLAALKDAPITKDNCYRLTPIWGKNAGHVGGYPCAMDGQGRFLYSGDIKAKKSQGSPLALALRPANPNYKGEIALTPEQYDRKYPFGTLTEKQLREGEGARLDLRRTLDSDTSSRGDGSASFLRRLDVGAHDEVAFDMGCGSGGDSISRDGTQLAFTWGSLRATNYNAVAVLKQGESLKQVRLILNWPKLDLISTLPAQR
jgi:Tol biopolymer transport system component